MGWDGESGRVGPDYLQGIKTNRGREAHGP